MADNYKEFDKAPIVEDDIVIRGFKFRKRELFLGAAVAVLALVCVILIAVLASAKSGQSPASPMPLHSPDNVCLNSACLHSSALVLDNLNASVEPCDNFFQYACGGFPTHNPIPPDRPQLSTRWNIYFDNEQKLRRLLETPVIRTAEWSAERKLKDFFMSCIDDYAKMTAGGNPFIERILPQVGGWWVLGTLNESTYDLQTAVRKARVDLWTNVFFTFYVKTDVLNWHKRALQLDLAGMGLNWVYLVNENTEKERQVYRKFMRTVAGYLIRDANVTLNETERNRRIDIFVNDTMSVEMMLAQMTSDSDPTVNPHDESQRLSLTQLNAQTSGGIDWMDFFSYMFSSANVNGDTKVVVLELDYIKRMDRWIANLGANKSRILNNYIAWRLAHRYAQDLSWDYIHANRDFYVALTGSAEFLGAWRYCFGTVNRDLTFAMSSLYVRDHFSDKNKQKAMEIVDVVRESLIQSLMKITWMDDSTKSKAERKLRHALLKLGYPDFMVDDDRMDQIYRDLSIDRQDYFANLLSLNKFYKKDWNMRLREDTDPTEWTYHTYDVIANFYNPWNELMVPAGILQPPFYDHKLPHYTNFGALGTLLAQKLLHAVDQQGALFKLDGSWWGQWWSNNTVKNYQSVRNCVIRLYQNKTQGPFLLPVEGPTTVPVNAAAYAPEALAETSGVRIAFQAYHKWVQDNGVEATAPGVGRTNDQMFFIAYAQSLCYNRHDILSFNQASRFEVQENIKVNMALRQLDDFARAFKCKAGSKMVAEKKCTMY